MDISIDDLAGSSLPLMGIGNLLRLAWRAVESHPLITPHGDWELAPSGEKEANVVASLPLMGIGNPSPAAMPLTSPSSLPLMGIGNALGVPPKNVWKACSLPLMGIGNVAGRRLPTARQHGLITPHGDWERGLKCAATPAG